MRISVLICLVAAAPAAVCAGTVAPRDGWVVIDSPYSYAVLVQRLDAAVDREQMIVVTRASATVGALAQNIVIPGNMVVGVFRNDFARRMLGASVAAGIEAPLRFYLTENPDGTATLTYKKPSTVFAPYAAEGGTSLANLAAELDGIFARIAEGAARP